MSNTMSTPKKRPSEEVPPPRNIKETLERYRLQVDRLTKSSYNSKDEAEKAGRAIKKAHPKVHVSIYDADESATTSL